MAFAHELLTQDVAGPAVWRLVGPDAKEQGKKLVARGLAPLPPRDLLVGLYQLWADPDEDESEAAAKTVESLPPPILKGALADPNLPPGVLDLLGRKYPRNEEVLVAIARHPRTDDETLIGIARLCPESVCDLLADNQARWLAAPGIVESLYQNPNCRMSVAQKMIELAVREGVELKLPNIDEIKVALGAVEEDEDEEDAEAEDAEDEAFRSASTRVRELAVEDARRLSQATVDDDLGDTMVPTDEQIAQELAHADEALGEEGGEERDEDEEKPELPEQVVHADKLTLISKLKPMAKIRMALLGNAFERSVLIRDSNKSVCMSAIKSPRVKEAEVEKYASNRSLSYDVIRYIALRRDWTKNYSIKLHLVLNPKTPMSAAMGFLAHLRNHDIRKVARSKNIPSALAVAAKRKVERSR